MHDHVTINHIHHNFLVKQSGSVSYLLYELNSIAWYMNGIIIVYNRVEMLKLLTLYPNNQVYNFIFNICIMHCAFTALTQSFHVFFIGTVDY